MTSGQTYTATLATAIDLTGTALAGPVVWSFTPIATGFHASVVLDGLEAPTAIQFAPDGRVFVAEKAGLIQVFDKSF